MSPPTADYRELQNHEAKIRRLVEANIVGIAVGNLEGRILEANDAFLRIVGYDREDLASGRLYWTDLTPPEWRNRDEAAIAELNAKGVFQPFEKDYFRKDGSRVPVLQGGALFEGSGNEGVAFILDLSEQKRAERALRLIADTIPGMVCMLKADWEVEFVNQPLREYFGMTLEELKNWQFMGVVHPDDIERVVAKTRHSTVTGEPYEVEHRCLRHDGVYRWFLIRGEPLRDENIALKQEIDRSFMFEEIVGSSAVLQAVLASIVKVARTDSTVLICGETGTGKELIARAIHKRSLRSDQAFVSVNCASIPASLIASELFGHEKGAFTGALQQRHGRFELAHGGTMFLDEIGELPAETQIALLRVLQERQFERVGGNKTISVDVRVITATNRDLSAAIAAGTFRADLFYRLNVFPIQVPPLRLRRDDIPVLVEYFVKRFAEKMGKQISKIDKNTIELCQKYPWPGNIRELQNIVERSVILCGGNTFSIDEAWLSVNTPPGVTMTRPMGETLQDHEREIIEAALAESKGRVAGPNGAAAKLGIPRSTLDRKIQQLKIKKHQFLPEP